MTRHTPKPTLTSIGHGDNTIPFVETTQLRRLIQKRQIPIRPHPRLISPVVVDLGKSRAFQIGNTRRTSVSVHHRSASNDLPRIRRMLEPNIVPPHALNASLLTPRASRLPVIALQMPEATVLTTIPQTDMSANAGPLRGSKQHPHAEGEGKGSNGKTFLPPGPSSRRVGRSSRRRGSHAPNGTLGTEQPERRRERATLPKQQLGRKTFPARRRLKGRAARTSKAVP